MTEDQMLTWLCAEVKRRYPNVRFPNPDYRVHSFYAPQWKCLAGVCYWKKGGDFEPVLAAFSKRLGVFRASQDGLTAKDINVLLPEGIKV